MEPTVLFTTHHGRQGQVGLITLNRPKMLNALTESMCIEIYTKLQEWEQDDQIKAIVICGAGERAFCAGGDIRAVYELRTQPELARHFFWHEYRLNHRIHTLSKPYIALLDGLTMGGGAGVSVNGHFRVATDRLSFAMPETGIGFFPDVGGSYFLSHCRGRIGWYLGLTGANIGVADAWYAGLINAHVASKNIPALFLELVNAPWDQTDLFAITQGIIDDFKIAVAEPALLFHSDIIIHCFSQSSVEEIITSLKECGGTWAQNVAVLLSARCPTSLKVVLEQLQRAANLQFEDCMRMEYRIANRFLHSADFFEGVRAAVIDKDRQPRWQPDSLAAVTAEQVGLFFAPLLEGEELDLSVPSRDR